jgi:hypothetical protein
MRGDRVEPMLSFAGRLHQGDLVKLGAGLGTPRKDPRLTD